MTQSPDVTGWPEWLRPGAIRWVRASGQYEATVAFYRDLIGLAIVGEFSSSFGEDGTIFGLPDTTVQLEIVRAQGPERPTGSFDQVVVYLDDAQAVATATARLRSAGLSPDVAPHPYWAANGAVVYSDPDGRGVVFAPWVYGRDPEPIDGAHHPPPQTEHIRVDWYTGDRSSLRALFEAAEDSPAQLDEYIAAGQVLAAWRGEQVVGHLQLIDGARTDQVELKNMAVLPARRGHGIGRRLVESAVSAARHHGYRHMVVATAAADIGNLRFYQLCGFRLSAVERDAFTAESGYPAGIVIDGVPLRDRVWLAREL